jgi:hypothetical protein
MRCQIQLEVFVEDELWLSRVVSGSEVTLGPNSTNTVCTALLDKDASLLTRTRDGRGFNVRLSSGMNGILRCGDRFLRIEDGLLLDARPEPLELVAGDRGLIRLANSEIRFVVVERRNRFRASLLPEKRLVLAHLAAASILIGALALVFSLAKDTPKKNSLASLKRRVALDPAFLIPLTKRASKRSSRKSKLAKAPEREGKQLRRSRKKRRVPRFTRRTDASRRMHRHVNRAARRVDRLLGRIDKTLADGKRLRHAGRSTRARGTSDPIAALDRLLPRRTLTLTSSARGIRLSSPAIKLKGLSHKKRATIGPSRRQIRAVIARASGPIRLCYERRLLVLDEPPKGTLVLRWTIDARGSARSLTFIKDSVRDKQLKSCVGNVIRGLRFPACGDSRCRVVFPFAFSPLSR